jgi:hydroxymethylpyrimidine pyrophosphatase-like HAD family hydrolase
MGEQRDQRARPCTGSTFTTASVAKATGSTICEKSWRLIHVIAFGDGDNDLSMFECATECYAPANADPMILDAADEVIGHHDEDGVARFLRQRFQL